MSTLTGRGKRVTVKDETETVLADFIIVTRLEKEATSGS